MVYAYIIGKNFLEKEYENANEAFDSLKRFQAISHEEPLFFLVSEKKLKEKDCALINIIQTLE
jgi:hypothetical protein